MASLNKNGMELFRLHLLREDRSYRSNGVVLINKGFGWKKGKTYEDIAHIHNLRGASLLEMKHSKDPINA
jgi:hypothetical protein